MLPPRGSRLVEVVGPANALPTPCNDVPTTFRLVELAVVERLIAGSLACIN